MASAKFAPQKFHSTSYPAIDPTRPELSTKGKTVIVVGGGGGIGALITKAFAKAGSTKIAIIGRSEKPMTEVKHEIETEHPGTTVMVAVADIADPESVGGAAHDIRVEVGAWDVLVNSAVYWPGKASLVAYDCDEFWQAFLSNVRFTQIFAKHFLSKCRPNATYIGVGTAGCTVYGASSAQNSAYTASKLAAARLDQDLASENPGLRVFTVHPGVVGEGGIYKKFIAQGGKTARDFGPDDPSLCGHFMVWCASPESEFLRSRFLMVNWDVEELKEMEEIIKADPFLLRPIIGGWPFK